MQTLTGMALGAALPLFVIALGVGVLSVVLMRVDKHQPGADLRTRGRFGATPGMAFPFRLKREQPGNRCMPSVAIRYRA